MPEQSNRSDGNIYGTQFQTGAVDTLVMNMVQEAARPVRPVWDVSRELRGPFVNHDEALAFAKERYRETALAGRSGSLFVIGPRGVGKSAFGVEAAYVLRGLYCEAAGGQEAPGADGGGRGVWGLYVDLEEQRAAAGGAAESHVYLSDALAELLQDLGVPADELPTAFKDRERAFRRITGEQPCIVIIEGVTSAAEAAPFATGDGSMVILTGRTEVPGLRRRGVQPLRLNALRTEDALALLRGFDGPEERLARLIDADPEGARALADRCGGLPLALQIVGAYLSLWPEETPASVAGRLDEAGARLPEEIDRLVEAEEGEPRLDEVVALGFGELRSEAAQRLYLALGELPGWHVYEGLAAALLGSPEEARSALGELVRACLMVGEGGGRYRWEPLIRHDAHRRVKTEPDVRRQGLKERAVDWYTASLARADRLIGGARSRATQERGDRAARRGVVAPFADDEAAARAWIARILDSVPGFMAMGVETEKPKDALVMAESCWSVAHDLRRGSVGAEVFRFATEIARGITDAVAVSRFANYHARALVDDGELDQATAVFGPELKKALGPQERAALLETRGLVYKARGEFSAAADDFLERREIHRNSGNVRGQVLDGYQMGDLYLSMGDANAAQGELEAVRELISGEVGRLAASDIGESGGRINDWRTLAAKNEVRLGRVYLRAGDSGAALEAGKAALEGFGEDGAPLRKADALAVMARAQGRSGDAITARKWASAAVTLYKRHHLHEKAGQLADLVG